MDRTKSESIRLHAISAAENGLNHGNYPLGYHRENWHLGVPEPDIARAPYIQLAFRLRAQGYSLRNICRVLTDGGLTTKGGNALSPQTLRGILANPYYMGKVTLHGASYPGKHMPIISPEEFTAAQSLQHTA